MSYEYYEYLSIERTATQDEIKRAYKKKAMELHPDRHGGDKTKEAEFKKVNEAYATLSDEQKKSHYDRFGTSEGMGGGFGGFPGGFDVDLGDIFSQFFGGGFGGKDQRQRDIGEDIEIQMQISLEDVIRGNTRKVEFQRQSLCTECHGRGGKTKGCHTCHGSGQVRERMQTVFGMIEQSRICSTCGGNGENITETCRTCHGKKYTEESITKHIDIPAGIENGMSIKIRNEGHEGRDKNGDLYITFSAPDREGGLVRDGHHLHYEVSLSPAEAVLGTEKTLDIPIIGKKTLRVKHGTQGGETETYTHEGLERIDRKGGRGDLILHYTIDIPSKLSSEERQLYTALRDIQGGKKIEKGFFENIFGA